MSLEKNPPKVSQIYHLEIMNACTKCNNNPPNSSHDVLLKHKNMNLLMLLKKNSPIAIGFILW